MNTDDPGQARLDQAARRAYAGALAQVSGGTMAQLHRRRHAALAGTTTRSRWRLPAAAFASLLVLGAGLGLGLRSIGDAPPGAAPELAVAVEPGIEAVIDELDQSPEFYVWLASRDADLLAME